MTRAVAAWNRFWFQPQPTSTLALVRIAVGLVATGWTASQLPTLLTFYGPNGVMPALPDEAPGIWGLLTVGAPSAVVVGAWVVTLLSAIALTVGLHTRLAAILLFLGILSFERRDPMVVNAGDVLLRVVVLYLALAPAGAALSLDRYRAHRDRFWEFPARAPWALRLIQIQLSVLYLGTVWSKINGETWRSGTAVSFALQIEDIHRAPVPGFITSSPTIVELLTFGTLAVELSIALFVWNRTLRPWVLGAGITLHLGIALFIMVGFFSLTILAVYLAFVPPETAARLVGTVRDRTWPHREAEADAGPEPVAEPVAEPVVEPVVEPVLDRRP
ncbi:HTTM domain-containing protein [Actinomycetospora endophytica]|uniref:HTTM domain-containing protein n=1 Tax=Actinomycetospora endophytica TaxID=2291215 RepID=A0ABS8P933_9PSEU|nr:HTTM domain-containing protein [Actinomycetospora endophytica]MCD2194783.1 HTTM domain-containing protein [Actinomycetospora endophytica]